MIRILKVMGLAMVAALALSGLVSATASATDQGFITAGSAGSPATIDGEQTTLNIFNRTGREISCEVAKFGSSSSVPGSATELTLVPTYEKCKAVVLGVPLPATVTMNGCDYKFTITKDTNPTTFTALPHVECPAGQAIEIHVYNDEAHTSLKCTYVVPAQTPAGHIHLENVAGTPNDVKGTITVSGVTSTRTSGTLTNCGAASDTAASLSGGATLRATNAANEFIAGSVS